MREEPSERGGTFQWSIPICRTQKTEQARLELRKHLPTLGSVERLSLMMRGGRIRALDGESWLYVDADPAGQVQKIIRHRDGWVWACLRCKREVEGDPKVRPVRCPSCKYRELVGAETLVYYLAEFTKGGRLYDGGIEKTDWLCGFGFWVKAIAGWPAYRAVDGWVLRESLRETSRKIERSHEWVRTAVRCVAMEWEREDVSA